MGFNILLPIIDNRPWFQVPPPPLIKIKYLGEIWKVLIEEAPKFFFFSALDSASQ